MKSNRWKPLDVSGEQNWTTRTIKSKWQFQRDTWRMSKNKRGKDVSSEDECEDVPFEESDPTRQAIKATLR